MSNPSKVAMKIARIILNGQKTINTKYGKKTMKGIANLIDSETMTLSNDEIIAIIEGLREAQRMRENVGDADMPLDDDAIDALCERLNCVDDTPDAPTVFDAVGILCNIQDLPMDDDGTRHIPAGFMDAARDFIARVQ